MLKKVPFFRLAGIFKTPRFSYATIDPKTPAATGTRDEVAEVEALPVHLRPYDKTKYEIASTKIKVSHPVPPYITQKSPSTPAAIPFSK